MVLRKTTIDNNVKSIPKTEQTRGGYIKQNKLKNNSGPLKQNKIFSQIKKSH